MFSISAFLSDVFNFILKRYSNIKIIVSGDIPNAANYTVAENKTIVIEPSEDDNAGITISSQGTLFDIENGGKLTIQGNDTNKTLTLKGLPNNNTALISVFGELVMETGVIITENNNTSTTINGGGVHIGNNGIFTMKGGKIRSENYSQFGGGVYVNSGGTFEMDGEEISGNSAVYGGGVFINTNGNFIMTSGSIAQNTVSLEGGGGGVYINGGSFEMSGGIIGTTEGDVNDSDYKGNTAGNGGGVHIGNNGTFTMTGGAISGNEAAGSGGGKGGGVFVDGGIFTMEGVSSGITGNTAAYGGGVALINSGAFTMNGGTISLNEAEGSGGATGGGGVYVNGNELTTFIINGGTVEENTATEYGGGVLLYSGQFYMSRGTLTKNHAQNGGGAAVMGGSFAFGTVAGDSPLITENTASNSGGGVWIFTHGNFSIGNADGTSSSITNNIADLGGGVYNSGTFFRYDGTISGNTKTDNQESDIYGDVTPGI